MHRDKGSIPENAIESTSANSTETASNAIICQRAVFGPGPSHTTRNRSKKSIMQKTTDPATRQCWRGFSLMASGLWHPANTLFCPLFRGFLALFSLSSGRSSHEVRKVHSFIFKHLTCSIFNQICFRYWVAKRMLREKSRIDGVRKMGKAMSVWARPVTAPTNGR